MGEWIVTAVVENVQCLPVDVDGVGLILFDPENVQCLPVDGVGLTLFELAENVQCLPVDGIAANVLALLPYAL